MKSVINKRKDYRVINVINRMPLFPFKEVITVKDFTSKKSDIKKY